LTSEPTEAAGHPTDLAELFARDPLSLSEADIDAIIERLRAKRHEFNLTGKAPRSAAGRKPSKPSPNADLAAQLDIKI